MAKWFKGTSVKMLHGDDFDDDEPWKLKTEKRCSFVLFFADWCGHCQTLKPEYCQFADRAQFIRVYAVDSDAESNLMSRINSKGSPIEITGFPSVIIYSDGSPVGEFSGDHNWQALLKDALKACHGGCKCDKI